MLSVAWQEARNCDCGQDCLMLNIFVERSRPASFRSNKSQ